MNKLQHAKVFKLKNRNRIKENSQRLECEADKLNEMKVKFYCLQEGILLD